MRGQFKFQRKIEGKPITNSPKSLVPRGEPKDMVENQRIVDKTGPEPSWEDLFGREKPIVPVRRSKPRRGKGHIAASTPH